ncbi:MAG: repressor LexA [Gaiellales bacterium]|nr:repressor LexA [Gaiellales bacterium]
MRSHPDAQAAQLTARQREILAFVNDHSAQHGYPPTVREIGTAVGLTSSSTVHAHLANLERIGLLRRDPAKPRALNLVGRSTKVPPAPEPAGIRMLPLLGQIAAGAPLLAEGQVEELLPVPELLTASGENFLLRVRGDSMIDDGIHSGDYVVVRRQETAENGEIIAALVDGGEATVKRIYREKDRIRLQPANASVAPIYADDVVVLGRIVGVFRRIP